jgi:hypothetical protein
VTGSMTGRYVLPSYIERSSYGVNESNSHYRRLLLHKVRTR